ncbi:phospholipase [uncultured Rhodoblastus sp.]|uniref:alpha/beta hydrolase family esterase n=1 Tax=uncultured Rhodoblastus sp. TaxID=543037 RepID=UPI0025D27105|nr:phospholipase [uncultured Rhodoblastus sp.]
MKRLSYPGAAMAGLLALAAGFFCPLAPASAAARLTIESGGISRTAVVVQRDRLKLGRRPLVIVLHRGGGVGAYVRRRLGLEEIAQSSKPIFLYPDAIQGVWPAAPGAEADRDIKFLSDLVEHFASQGAIDPRRIFIVGLSSGGAFAYRAACAGLGRPVAGLATLIAAMPEDLANCAPPPLAYMAISGQSDPLVPYAGGRTTFTDGVFNSLPAEAALAIFARINGCGARRDERAIADRDKRDHSRAYILSYSGCKAPVELIRIDGGGHRIPGHRPDPQLEPIGGENNDFDASRAVWEFLRRNGA